MPHRDRDLATPREHLSGISCKFTASYSRGLAMHPDRNGPPAGAPCAMDQFLTLITSATEKLPDPVSDELPVATLVQLPDQVLPLSVPLKVKP